MSNTVFGDAVSIADHRAEPHPADDPKSTAEPNYEALTDAPATADGGPDQSSRRSSDRHDPLNCTSQKIETDFQRPRREIEAVSNP